MTDNNSWVKLFHKSGAQVTIAIPATEPSEIAKYVDECLNHFTVDLPGVEEGEKKELCKAVARRVKVNDDGTDTPVIDLYGDGKFKFITIYLNTPIDIKTFEEATKLKLDSIPLNETASAAIEIGKNPAVDKKYIVACNAQYLWKLNPRYEGAEDKKHSKRMFVRWVGVSPMVEAAKEAGGEVKMTLEMALKRISSFDKKPYSELSVADLESIVNNCTKRVNDDVTPPEQKALFQQSIDAAKLVLKSKSEPA